MVQRRAGGGVDIDTDQAAGDDIACHTGGGALGELCAHQNRLVLIARFRCVTENYSMRLTFTVQGLAVQARLSGAVTVAGTG